MKKEETSNMDNVMTNLKDMNNDLLDIAILLISLEKARRRIENEHRSKEQ